ncbi:NADP-dependent oxidoreductase [Amycolatopsis sp. NPDC051061]|uniref:NADP-dependent oxidoreductase n=1 Tax=Amycolatopsis sp. NPDC051061 TaxID=3155042 RepID=UPI0034260270
MRAAGVFEFGGPEKAVVHEVDDPVPGPGEVRVRVAAAAVNPFDAHVRSGAYVALGAAPQLDVVGLGADAAGVVDAVGPGTHRFRLGDEVVALEQRIDVRTAAQAELLVLPEWAIAPKPSGWSMVQAATLPLNATTADQALDALDLSWGDRVLITGAAGAVGSYAVQLAAWRGLRVVALASAHDEAYLSDIGAETVLARSDRRLTEVVLVEVPGGVDGVLDAANVGLDAIESVRHGGAYVSLLDSAPRPRRDVRAVNLAYHTDGARLARLSALATAGALTTRVAEVLPLSQVEQAHRTLGTSGTRGRTVLEP